MKTLELPNLWYGSFLMLSVVALYSLQLGAALCLPKVAPSQVAGIAKKAR